MNFRLSLAAIISALLFLGTLPLSAQDQDEGRYSFEFRGEPLTEVLEQVARATGANMVYDPALVKGIHVYERIQDQSVPDLLNTIFNNTSLDFLTLSSGTIVIVLTVNDVPSYGSYLGKVVDRQTGEPLPNATVMLADASGGTSTGPAGTFALNRLITGTHTIVFSYVGYEPVYKTVDIRPNQNIREEVALQPKPVDVMPVVVTGHVPQMPFPPVKDQSINPTSQWEATGNMQDAIRSLSIFPGVQYGLPMTDLHLQGGQRGDHRIRLDGVPVYNPHSFGRMFSAFSPYAINKVHLHKAGFGVQEGSQVAGMIDLSHDVHSINENRLMLQGDPLSLNLRGDLNTAGDDDPALEVMSAVRSNYWNIYKQPRLNRTLREWDELDPLITNLLIESENDASLYEPREHTADVRFYDIHLASDYQINSYNTLSSSFYLGKNYVSTDLLRQAPPVEGRPEYLYARDEYNWNNFMGQLTYNQLVSSRLDLRTQLSFSSNRFNHRYIIGTNYSPYIPGMETINSSAVYADFQSASAANRVPAQRNNNRIQHLILRSDGTYSFSPNFNLDAGIQTDYVNSSVNLSDLFYLQTLTDQQSFYFSTYLNANWTWGTYWKLTLGSRGTMTNAAKQFYAEPRASLQFDQPDAGIGCWSAKLSGGLYRQFINQYEITNPGPTSLVPSFTVWSHAGASRMPEAWHLSGSFHLEPTESTRLNLEWFYKWQPTTYNVSYDNLLEGTTVNRYALDAFAESTEMRTFGTGIRLNQSIADSKAQMMFGYDFNLSSINMQSQFGRRLPPPWNEPHRFQLRTLWRMLPELTAVAKWQSVLGRSWGFRQAYYNYLLYEGENRFGNYTFSHPENDRLSPYHQLDLSLIYKPSFGFADAELRLDLINLLNRRNTIDWSLQPVSPKDGSGAQHEKRERTMPGFSPSVSMQFYF